MIKLKYFIIVFFILFSNIYASKIAVATKVNGLAEIMPEGKEDFSKLKPGTILSDGDMVRTGSSGFVAIIFIDDKSILKLKGNSEAIISGQRTAASISKKINMNSGTVRATISKQNVDFVIQTPTSVASVKGTDFWLVTDPATGDQIICIEGSVGLINIETGEEVDVTEDMTCTLLPDGTFDLTETDASNIPDDPTDEQEGPSQVRVYLDGPNGEQRVIVIDYQ